MKDMKSLIEKVDDVVECENPQLRSLAGRELKETISELIQKFQRISDFVNNSKRSTVANMVKDILEEK